MAVRSSRAVQVYKRFGLVLVLSVFGVYAAVNLTGPQGVSALFGKWNELERIQRENATLAGKLEDRKEKLRILKENAVQQELEIRRKLKRLKKGETIYDVPDPEPEPPK